MLFALLHLCTLPSFGSDVTISGEQYLAMRAPTPAPVERGPGPWVSARDIRLTPMTDALRIHGEWTLQATKPGWVDLSVVDSTVRVDSATLGGKAVALKSLVDGDRHLIAYIDGPTRLVLDGEVVGDTRRGVPLVILEAPVGRLQVVSSDPVVTVKAGEGSAVSLNGIFWTGQSSLQIQTSRERAAKKTDRLVVGEVGLGVTVSDGAVSAKARIDWRIVQGSVESLVFSAPGAGPDLSISGPRVAEWDRKGDRVTVTLVEPQDHQVSLAVSWSKALPDTDEAEVSLPGLVLEGVFRTERALQIARDGDREIVPQVDGWEAIPAAALPEVARGLVTGTPTSAWTTTGDEAPRLSLLRFVPVSGPSTLVDVAAMDGALSQEGRLLMRAHYTVRNDRGAFLRVTPPPGASIVSARVGGQPARIAVENGVWLVPLLKSVETVQGLLDFPVDLVLLADGEPFSKREERQIPLPAVDADVAVTRVSLSLPMGWMNRLDEGEGGRVERFSEGQGLTYGFAVGDAKVAEADALFQNAVGAWMKNDFEGAQGALNDLRALGADNENVGRLQSNIDLVLGEDEAGEGQAVAMQRRVKEQARARANKDVAKQEVLLKKADEAYWSGNYDEAETRYREALEIGETLERLEQSESVEQQYVNSSVSGKLSKSSSEKKKKSKKISAPAKEVGVRDRFSAGGGLPVPEPQYKERTEIDFDGLDVTGELVKPNGAFAVESEGLSGTVGGVVVDIESTSRSTVLPGVPLAEESDPPIQVLATSMDVVIPTFGETVRYQHLLLPAGQAHTVPVVAKKRGNP